MINRQCTFSSKVHAQNQAFRPVNPELTSSFRPISSGKLLLVTKQPAREPQEGCCLWITAMDHALLSISGPLFRTLPTSGLQAEAFISSDSKGRSRSMGGLSVTSLLNQRV